MSTKDFLGESDDLIKKEVVGAGVSQKTMARALSLVRLFQRGSLPPLFLEKYFF
jgi:hypothetical protein